jgi:hypothetical protein
LKRKWLIYCLIALVVLIGAFIGANAYLKTLGPRMRTRIVKALAERFNADVDLAYLDIALLPQPTVVGEGLTIRHKGWGDTPPLIHIRQFSAQTDLVSALGAENEVRLVTLEGLEIHIPPRGRRMILHGSAGEPGETATANPEPGQDRTKLKFNIQRIVADGTRLIIDPAVDGKLPLEFDIHRLTLQSVGPNSPMKFVAELTNAKPPGTIHSTGHFGPWQRDEPRSTPVDGDYRFTNANLGVFNGIAGTLASTGRYSGVLQHIIVDGVTDTPNFAVKHTGTPVDLKTKFHAIVDGTNGDTFLDPVDASFRSTELICKGGVYGKQGQQGKTVMLDVTTARGRVEDLLHLTISEERPMLTGAVDFRANMVIPPGTIDILDKLQLQGNFGITAARFNNSTVQRRIQDLSERARGISKKEAEEAPQETVASNFRGRFDLRNGLARFSKLSFEVPGALVTLDGTYNLESTAIDMRGLFRMKATLSQTQSGWKRLVLIPFDRLFEKHGAGFQLPFRIEGDKEHPDFHPEFFHRGAP